MGESTDCHWGDRRLEQIAEQSGTRVVSSSLSYADKCWVSVWQREAVSKKLS